MPLEKNSRKVKRILKKLDTIVEYLQYYMGASDQFKHILNDLDEIEQFIIQSNISKQLDRARFKKKLKILQNISDENNKENIDKD